MRANRLKRLNRFRETPARWRISPNRGLMRVTLKAVRHRMGDGASSRRAHAGYATAGKRSRSSDLAALPPIT